MAVKTDGIRERIEIAATTCFCCEGADCDLVTVAREVGEDVATVQRLFPDRVDLVRAVVLRSIDAAERVVKDAANIKDPIAALRLASPRGVRAPTGQELPARLITTEPGSRSECAGGEVVGTGCSPAALGVRAPAQTPPLLVTLAPSTTTPSPPGPLQTLRLPA
jgi:hypothetical protein